MSYRSGSSYRQTIPSSQRGGCLPVFILVPASALAIGLALMFGIGKLTSSTSPSIAERGKTAHPGVLAPFFTPEVQYWGADIEQWGEKWDLDPNLIATVMQIESCGDPKAISSAGASGLFQVMPFHFKDGEDRFDPQTNALRGLGYLKESLSESAGDVRLGLAGYNGGISIIQKEESHWPDETQRYAEWGTGIYQEAVEGAAESTVLNQWLAHGGNRLCSQARQHLNQFQP